MGADKAALLFGGRALLDHVVARLAPPGVPVLVSTGAGDPAIPVRGTLVFDETPGLGPLAGISRLLHAARSDCVLIVPTDLPLFPPRGSDVLCDALGDHDAIVCSSNGRVEPFPTLIRRSLSGTIASLLERGHRRADAYIASTRTRVVPFADLFPGVDAATAFTNVNTPDDLARAEALFASERS